MTRLVVVDAVLLALEAVYVAWMSRIHRGSRINLFSGPRPPGRARWMGAAAAGLIPVGLVLGSAGYGFGTRWVNFLVFFAAVTVVVVGGAAPHNRALDRR